MEPAHTRFGAPWFPPRAATYVLRARASRFGHALRSENTPTDAAAAVIGVDLWMCAMEAGSLDQPARYGTPAVSALTACIARAAGFPVTPGVCDLSMFATPWPSDDMLSAVEFYITWCETAGVAQNDVFYLVAGDLAVGSADPRLRSALHALDSADT